MTRTDPIEIDRAIRKARALRAAAIRGLVARAFGWLRAARPSLPTAPTAPAAPAARA